MTNSLCLVLALCATAAPQDRPGSSSSSPAYVATNAQPVVSGQPNTAPQPWSLRDGPVRSWLRNRLGSRSQPSVYQPACAGCQSVPQTVPGQLYQPIPQVVPAQLTGTEPPLPNTVHTTVYRPAPDFAYQAVTQVDQEGIQAAPNMPVAKKYESRVGHEMNYSWITGHLFYVHADGGRWVVRYALPSEVDKFGGSVVLAPGVEMKNYREGDLVCVIGEVLNEQRFSRSLGGALYRVNVISLIERSDP